MRTYLKISGAQSVEVKGVVVAEVPLTIHVNGQRLVTMLCSPFDVDALVVGYLWMERVIDGVDDIARLDVCEVDGRADVELVESSVRGAWTTRPAVRLRSSLRVPPDVLFARMTELADASVHYKQSRGIHSAALCDTNGLLLVAEDVARRNALDKIKGRALMDGVDTIDRILVSTGRISSEMLLRAARIGTPVVASRTSPTDMALRLAEGLDITVCGYVRPGGLNLYVGTGVVVEKTRAQV